MTTKEDIHELIEKYYGEKKAKKEYIGKKGYKYCPNCEDYIPARSKKCSKCEKEFIIGEEYEPPKELTPEEKEEQDYIKRIGLKGVLVYTPSGPCPVDLTSIRKNDVFDWCDAVIYCGGLFGVVFYYTAIQYWVREYFTIGSKEYIKVIKLIKEWTCV